MMKSTFPLQSIISLEHMPLNFVVVNIDILLHVYCMHLTTKCSFKGFVKPYMKIVNQPLVKRLNKSYNNFS